MNVRPLVVLPVRSGILPSGSLETVAEALDISADTDVLLIGSTLGSAAGELAGRVAGVLALEFAEFSPGVWADLLRSEVGEYDLILLPASPDGRDLAVRLAASLDRPLVAAALSVSATSAVVCRGGGQVQREVAWAGPVVATLQPHIRGTEPADGDSIVFTALTPNAALVAASSDSRSSIMFIEVTPPDAATMDLAEAPRLVGGGAGMMSRDLDDGVVADRFSQLTAIGESIGASMGATRVVTDAGFVPHARQIGTTGVVVDPDVYLAFGISGAVQHTAGLGHPDHIISVNTDPHCPMMAMANLAIVADANATLDELALLLDVRLPGSNENGTEIDG